MMIRLFSASLMSNHLALRLHLKTIGDRAFASSAAQEWNWLPEGVKCAPSLACF